MMTITPMQSCQRSSRACEWLTKLQLQVGVVALGGAIVMSGCADRRTASSTEADRPAGGVLITKDVETREVIQPVELRTETVEVERLTRAEARKREITAKGGTIDEKGEIFVPLERGVAVVEKVVQPRGVVTATTTSAVEQEDVGATLRREVVDIERRGSVPTGQAGAPTGRTETQAGQTGRQTGTQSAIARESVTEDPDFSTPDSSAPRRAALAAILPGVSHSGFGEVAPFTDGATSSGLDEVM